MTDDVYKECQSKLMVLGGSPFVRSNLHVSFAFWIVTCLLLVFSRGILHKVSHNIFILTLSNIAIALAVPMNCSLNYEVKILPPLVGEWFRQGGYSDVITPVENGRRFLTPLVCAYSLLTG